MEMLKQISTLNWQKQQQSSDDLTTCGDPARLASRLNWTSTPPSLSLQPYTPARLWRVQLEYVSSWTSFTSATYGRFWALHGKDHVTNMEVLSRTGQQILQNIVAERRLRIAGHIIRMPPGRPANHAMSSTPRGSGRRRGRPTKTWRSTLKEDLVNWGVDWNSVRTVATNRSRWRTLAAHCPVKDRRI